MNSNYPLVSFITINFNNLAVTCEFLDSTRKLLYRNFEIIVVDNASDEDPSDHLSKNYPYIRIIRNKTNLGFSGGNNIGIAAAKGDYIFIINNDTEVTSDLIDKLLIPFLNDNSIGVVCPKIRYFSHPEIIQYAGFSQVNPFTGRNTTIGDKELDTGQHDKPRYTAYAHGAAMMLKKEVIEKTRGFEEIFFLYYEELDWSARIIKAGYRIYYEPSAVIYHKESVSVGKDSTLKTFYLTRNRMLFMRRHTHGILNLCWPLFFLLVTIPKNSALFILQGKSNHLKAFWKGIIWNIMHNKDGKQVSLFSK